MSFFVENKGGDFERVAPGLHLARCYRIVDLGTQKTEFKGQIKFQRKVMLGWEILGTDDRNKPIRMADGRPFAIFKNYTLSWADSSNLRQDLQSWRGRPFSSEEVQRFDLKNILGAFCMLNVIDHQSKNGRTYSNINGVTPVPPMIKAAGLPAGVNPPELFNLSQPDWEMYEKFGEGLKMKISASPEYQKIRGKSDYDDSDIPVQDPEEDGVPF